MKKQELVEAILEESNIYHNIRIGFNQLDDTSGGQIDNELYDGIIWQTSESLINLFKEDWEANHSGKVWTCGRMGATLYWDSYWNERHGYRGFVHSEDELQEFGINALREVLKDIREFNEAVKGLMIDFYSNVNDEVTRQIEEKDKADKKDKIYNKILETIKENNFVKRLFHDLIYKDL